MKTEIRYKGANLSDGANAIVSRYLESQIPSDPLSPPTVAEVKNAQYIRPGQFLAEFNWLTVAVPNTLPKWSSEEREQAYQDNDRWTLKPGIDVPVENGGPSYFIGYCRPHRLPKDAVCVLQGRLPNPRKGCDYPNPARFNENPCIPQPATDRYTSPERASSRWYGEPECAEPFMSKKVFDFDTKDWKGEGLTRANQLIQELVDAFNSSLAGHQTSLQEDERYKFLACQFSEAGIGSPKWVNFRWGPYDWEHNPDNSKFRLTATY